MFFSAHYLHLTTNFNYINFNQQPIFKYSFSNLFICIIFTACSSSFLATKLSTGFFKELVGGHLYTYIFNFYLKYTTPAYLKLIFPAYFDNCTLMLTFWVYMCTVQLIHSILEQFHSIQIFFYKSHWHKTQSLLIRLQ